MAPPEIAPYGAWASPVTSELIVASTIDLGDVQLDGGDVYWLEARPQEGGRSVVMRRSADGAVEVTPPLPPAGEGAFNVRSRVHEYGGAAYTIADGTLYFSNDGDQRLYRQDPGGAPRPITPPPPQPRGLRYADAVPDRARGRLIAVHENHCGAGKEPQNTLVEIALDGAREPRVLVSGSDFYAAPRVSPDGAGLAWIEWRHPNMPWDGTELWLGRFGPDGGIAEKRRIAGGAAESVVQPEWSPDGVLHFVSDRSGWWNLYRWTGEAVEPIYPLDAEFGRPQWGFRRTLFGFLSARHLVASYSKDGFSQLALLDLKTLSPRAVATPYTDISWLRADAGGVYFRGGSPDDFPAIVRLAPDTGEVTVLRRSTCDAPRTFEGYISRPQPVEFPTEGGVGAHGFFYAPTNRDFAAPAGELPPLIVVSHGGPTGAASATLGWGVQYWTSRGFAVLDVNYGGSSGYGRAYRERLRGKWGVVDVEDCVNGAKFLAASGRVDGRRMAIRGSSAGGYTALCALTFRDVFATGASYYGISDLEALARDTHKFEARYLDGLVGPYPQAREIYRERSPVHFTERLTAPMALFQGAEDAIVPPRQAEAMAAALERKGLPCLYLLFAGEQHGLRRADNIKRALDAELYFYSVFLSGAKLRF
ncbi:MAG TPA: prolyl oligopeptidase family serine peptidase [Stellaceae bacterium]|nr:prolyl oligopeptidase family serine peptidase [Stellaceae bacterium]